MHESHINDHRSSSDDVERDSTPDDRLCCAGENSSSQKSDFYLRKDVKNVPSESKQHFKSKHSKKAFQKPDNSLLNFHFERPTQTSSYQSSGNSVRNYTSSERRYKARLSMLSKETFLQAK